MQGQVFGSSYLIIILLGTCCTTITADTKWDTNGTYKISGYVNGRPYWMNADRKYAFWHDGHTGPDSDWFFGFAENIGKDWQDRDSLMASNKDTTCPYHVTDWAPHHLESTRVFCGIV